MDFQRLLFGLLLTFTAVEQLLLMLPPIDSYLTGTRDALTLTLPQRKLLSSALVNVCVLAKTIEGNHDQKQ